MHQVLPTSEAPWPGLQGQWRDWVRIDEEESALEKMGVVPKADSVVKMASSASKQEDTCDKESARRWLIAPSFQDCCGKGKSLQGWQNTILGRSAVPNPNVCIHGSQSTEDSVTRTQESQENINTDQHLTSTHSYLMPLASERETSGFLFCRGLLT